LEKRVLPNKFQDYLLEAAGSDRTPIIMDALESTTPSVSIRLNPLKPLSVKVESIANEAIALGDKVSWCPDGYYLPSRPNFTLDPAFHAGAYYVQEPSSMFLALLKPLFADISQPRVLDLCAAPGGKTTHLVSMLPLNSYIVANEIVKNRVAPLKENLLKWGNHRVEVTSKDASEVASYCKAVGLQFDFILADAPCSGEGMFRKDPVAISEWSEDNVKTCAARQKRILSDIWPALAPGGYLAYSTCTFNIYENDQNVTWIQKELGARLVSLEELYHNHSATSSPDTINHSSDSATSSPGSTTLSVGHLETLLKKSGVVKGDAGGYRLFPGLVRGEGLFFALFRKGINSDLPVENEVVFNKHLSPKHSSSKGLSAKNLSPKELSAKHSSSKCLSAKNLSPKELSPKHSSSQFLPNPEDALSITGSNDIPRFELSKDIALKYLARQSIKLEGAPLGYLIVTYGGLPLGYVKNLGTRANNLYPINWRIRKSFGSV
jgi:16S rRNA C967 or C1407 C5-methylase (RsmB/RsmF family)